MMLKMFGCGLGETIPYLWRWLLAIGDAVRLRWLKMKQK